MNPRHPFTVTAFAVAMSLSGVFAAEEPKSSSAQPPVEAAKPVVKPAVKPTTKPTTSKTAERAKPVVPAGPTFETYRLIGDRNIFNPNRIGRSRASEAPAPRNDVISFVGTMQYEKGLFAFFDSPDASYRKALNEGGTLGKFTVKGITADSVELERDAKPLTLRMGQQLRRPEGGEWSVVGAEIVRSEARAAEAAANPGPGAPIAIPADASDALRRLMEKRQQQLKQ
jgi:hypothetical protein